jgi:hypothetical protein
MTPKFLREEAARFRGMADEHTREASKLRLLSMATDGEVEANNPEASVKMALGLKDSTLAARRPVGRPRLRLAT